jgi:oxygen-independent coproporphyrinogen III oxidase
MAGLYIHIPFCVRKCRYCDFYSVPMHGGLISGFLDALDREFAARPAEFVPETVFIGGGTPTALAPDELTRLLSMIHQRFDLGRVTEWTCEANPGTLTREKAQLLRDAGVNRVSLGVQSFDPQTLAFLGRIHSPTEARDAYQLLRDTGFGNVNLDLMYGIPGTPREVVESDLAQIANLAPEHVASYCLIFEDGTPLTNLRDAGEVAEVDDEEDLEQYRIVRARLRAAGFGHYEISNFAKPGFECRHNLLYWSGGEYLGFGPAAHGHWRGTRYGNLRSVEDYARALREGRSIRTFEEHLEPEAKARETLVMSLRRLGGVSRAEFLQATGFDYGALRGKEIAWLCEEGLLRQSGDVLGLTEKGLFVSDAVFRELV